MRVNASALLTYPFGKGLKCNYDLKETGDGSLSPSFFCFSSEFTSPSCYHNLAN